MWNSTDLNCEANDHTDIEFQKSPQTNKQTNKNTPK